MPYPPLPIKNQYKDWFPEIKIRPVPLDDKNAVVTESALAMQPEEQGGKKAEVFSPAKRVEFGALNLWFEGGGKKSTSYNDGPEFDYGKHKLESNAPAKDEAFNYVPGSDEDKIKIHWEVFGKQNIASAKLELFCRGHKDPIWKYYWGDEWGTADAAITKFPSEADGEVKYKGEYKFADVKPDKTLQLKNALGDMADAFPKELLTVAHSPYQLRLTLSGDEKIEKDKFAFPLTAWTYVHVLVHSFTFEFGKLEWLSAKRDDIDATLREAVIGTRKSTDAKEYGLEGGIVEELRVAAKGKDEWKDLAHAVSVTVNHNTKRNLGGSKGEDTSSYEKMWGLGPRIPLTAKPRLMAMDGSASDAKAVDALTGSAVLWDWDDSANEERWKDATKTPTEGDAKLTQDFISRLHDAPAKMFHPAKSSNCPVKRGGKYGDVKAPFFLPQDKPDTSGSGLPYQVKACDTRMWAAIGLLDAEGQTGVVLQPARQAGDAYTVSAYLMTDGLDTGDKIDLPEDSRIAPSSPAGTFTVFRRLDVFHATVGDIPTDYGAAMIKDAKEKAKAQAWLDLRFITDEVKGGGYGELMKKAIELEAKNTSGEFDFFGLEIPRMLKIDASTSAFLNLRSRDDFNKEIKKLFEQGKARLVKTKSANFHFNQVGVKRSDDSMGIPVYLEEEDKDGNKVCFYFSEPGKPAIADKENAKAWGTEAAVTVELALPDARSCWEVKCKLSKNTTEHGKHVMVLFPGGGKADLNFKSAGVGKGIGSGLSDAHKKELRDKLIAAVKSFDDGKEFAINIEGHEGASSSSKARIANIQKHLDELVNERLIIERKELLDQYTLKSTSASAERWCEVTGADKLFLKLIGGFAEAYAEKNKLVSGQILIQAARFTSLSDYKEDREKAKGERPWLDYPSGGALGGALKDKKDLGVVYLITPDPDSDGFAKALKGKTKKEWAILLHELGHGVCLNHALRVPPSKNPLGNEVPKQHVLKESCIMSYDPKSDQFCALCMLRIRGWKWVDLENAVKPPKLSVSFGIGDPNRVFLSPLSSTHGLLERLQVLGLFNRPLKLYETEAFKQEFIDCHAYSVKLAQRLIPGIDTYDGVMNEALRKFWFSGGVLPKEGEQARMRVWGHYHPFYANMDVSMRYGDPDKKDSIENAFKMMAFLGDIRATYESQNPALGSYPIDITVTDDRGFPAAGAKVFVQLVAPKPEGAWAEDSSGTELVGGKSFIKGAGRNKVHDKVAAYEKAHIKPGDGDDPQKDNVHADLGGKRGLQKDGDVSTPNNEYKLRNIFSPPDAALAMSLEDKLTKLPMGKNLKDDSPIKYSVMLTADEDGIARVNFTPSNIGGDRYRLCATVYDANDPHDELARAETGDLITWRTFRIGEYRTLPNVADLESLSDNQKYFMNRFVSKSVHQDALAPITTIDLKKFIGLELAKAYGEVIFEDAALNPKPLDQEYWKRFDDMVDGLTQRYLSIDDMNIEYYRTTFAARLKLDVSDGAWKGTIPAKFYPGYVAIGLLTDPLRSPNFMNDSVADDFDALMPEDPATGKFRKLSSKDKVFGWDEDRWERGTVNAPAITRSSIDYNTGAVEIVFAEQDLQQYFPRRLVGSAKTFGGLDKFQIVGATEKNTDDGIIHIWIVKSKSILARWDFTFYSSMLKDPSSVVARATGVKKNAKKVKASPVNGSGLSLRFDAGDDLPSATSTVDLQLDIGMMRVAALYWPTKAVDHKALIDHPEKSPWLLNLTPPDLYNKNRDPDYAEAPEWIRDKTKPSVFDTLVAGKDPRGWAETYFMRGLGAALAGGQGICYYPGQLYLHASVYNPVQGIGLYGKGTGNTAFIFQQDVTDPARMFYLFLHETGHCLYGVHAYAENGWWDDFHDCKDDEQSMCIMAGFEVAKSINTFCGKCVAGFRGLLTMEGPLQTASLPNPQRKAYLTKFGDSLKIRTPKSSPVNSGLVLAVAVDDPHILPTIPVDNTIVVQTTPVKDTPTASVWVDIEVFPQEKSNWCWAAASQMLRKFVLAEDVTQAAIASDALFDKDTIDCTLEKNDSKCNQQNALHLTGLDVKRASAPLTWEEIKNEVDAKRAFIFANESHYFIGYGYEEGPGGNKLYYFDPKPVGVGLDSTMTHEDYKRKAAAEGATYYEIKAKG
jgi:hypothetical protein